MPDKKYLIEIPDMPDGSGVWDAEKWERNKDAFMADYPNAQVFELGEYDEADSKESDQILLSFEDEASSGIWDQAKWERNKYAFTKDNPEAQVSRVRYVDYWGQKAEANRAEKAALQQPDEERNARLAELGYYDDLSEGQRVFDVNAPSMIGLKPLSSAIDTNSVSGHTTYLDPRVQEFFANDTAYTDKMAEIARLDAEYEQNPNVIAQREWEAQQAKEAAKYRGKLREEAKEFMATQIDAASAAEGERAKYAHYSLGGRYLADIKDIQENTKKEKIATALKFLEKADIAAASAGKGFWAATADWAKENGLDAFTQGDIESYNEIGDILTRLEKEVGDLKEENLTEEVFDKYLSPEEQTLIKSFFEYNKAMADAQQDMSRAYKGGKIFAESIPFMLEFLATGGIYKGVGRAATKGLERALVKWVSKAARNTASRTARKIVTAASRDLLYGLTGTAARTLVTPGTYERMAEASVEIEDGHLNRAKNAAIAAADMYVENLSEISGGLIGKTLGLAGKGVGKLIAKTPLSKVGGMLADNKLMQSISAFMPKLEALGFHGLPEEIGEEFIGNAIREVLNIQPGALKEMVSDDNFGAMLIGFAPMTLIGAAGGAISLGVINYEAAKLGNKMREMMSDHYSAEEMDAMMSTVQNAGTAEEIQQAIKPMALAIANAAERGMLTQEQAAEEIEMLYQWGGFMAQNNALLFSKRAQDNELANAKRAEMADRYGRFWQEDETESVQVATLNNGSTVFVTSAPAEDGKITTIDVQTGKKGFANISDIASTEVEGEQIQSSNKMTMAAFLNGQIAMGRKTAEETRMTNERNAQIDALRAEITPGTRINLGTEGSPVYVFAKKTSNNGVTIVDETGMESTLGWEQAADALGKPIIVETDQQKLDAEVSARLQRLAERRMQRNISPVVDNATTEAAEESAEVVAQEQKHIPLNEDGTVNEAAFWTQDPEGYVKWNDEQNKDGGQDSLRQIAISKQELFGMLNEAATGQNTSNPTMRKAAEKQVAAIAEKIARLEALEMSYADALAEEKEAVKQTAATPTATMSEEQLEQMDAQYQGILGKTRVQSERVRVMQEYLDKLAENSAPIKVLTKENYEEVMRTEGCPEDDIKRVGTAIRTSAITGAMIAGFASNGVTFVMADTIADINSARVTYIHERQHLLNSQNPEVVKQFAAALGDKENALRILETFVGKNGLEEYKNDPIEKLADEIICRSMEIVYSTENYSVDLQNQGLSEEAINIINTIDNGQRTDKSLTSARRSSYANVSQRENIEENGRNSEQVSGGILDGQETGSLGSSSRGDGVRGQGSTGEGGEVISDDDDASFRIVSEPEEEEPSSPFMVAAQQEGESIRFSITTEESLQDKIRKFAKTKDGKKTGWTEDDIESIIAETESLIDAIHRSSTGNEFYDEFAYKEPTIRVDWRDGEAKPIVTWTRANIEYKYDMSADLLCINNEGLEQVLSSDKMVALMEMFVPVELSDQEKTKIKFTPEDYLELYNTLKDLGFVVPCKGCFDAAGRFKMLPSIAQKFAAEVNATIDERNKDPKAFDAALKARKGDKTPSGLPASSNTKSDAIAVGVAGDNLTEHVKWTQLMSADGQTKMLSDWGGIFRAWQRTGAARPKDKLLPEPYYGDIVSSVSTIIGKYGEKTPSFRDTLVNQGTGLRRNSHSEFRPVLAIDEIQFLRDAFLRNLTVFKYMKELDDVRLFGKMGVKFNMSFFPEYVPGTKAAGLDKDGNYIASEESVGSREFPYQGEDGKRHYNGMKGWAEAQKYINKDVSLSSVIFSIPHLLKALTDVPTPSDMRGIWGSLIPFHSSGATTASLYMQGLGMARANGIGHGFNEAFSDYGKGVTNFEAVQNDRFGEGWYIVSGKKAGNNVEPGHKLEFVNGNHYYNQALGVHLFASGYILDSELSDGMLAENGELNLTAEQKKALMHKFSIDYNDKVRELNGPYAYKDAADYYIAELPKLGLIPRFDFEVSEEKFLEMCEAAKVDPRHPKLGWKGEGNSWSPIDSEAYYSLFCDYGMTDPATGEWAPHMPVGYVNEQGEREFRLPENAVEIVKEGLDRFSEVRRSEATKIDNAIETFAERSVEKGRLSQKDVDKVLGKKASKSGAIDLVEEAKKAVAREDAKKSKKAKKSEVRMRITPEMESIRDRSKADGTFMKAPNGQPTNLTEEQWLMVRTQNFIKWFGDWIAAYRAEKIKNLQPEPLVPMPKDKTSLEVYKSLRNGVNKNDGIEVKFFKSAYKKVIKVGQISEQIIASLPNIFDSSVLAYSENDNLGGLTRPDGTKHKEHRNVDEVRHYVGKVEVDGKVYYVRFTVNVQKNNTGLHSYFTTDIDLYENITATSASRSELLGARLANGGIVDAKLESFFEKANNSSKVVDENGEPKVVFHQTNQKIYVNRETGENWDELGWKEKMEWDERDDWEDYWEEQDFNTFSRVNARTTNEFDGFFFAPEYDEYHEYGDRTIAAFVNIKNPASREDYNIDSRYNDAGRDERIRLQEAGFDGVIRMDGDNVDEYIAFEPNQIKSATDNNGDFNPNNNDIRFRITPEQDKAYMDAVEAGDMETAQRMVIEAAKLAMPNTKVVDENGNPKVVYHGTGSEFYTFRNTSDSNELGAGYYFSDSYEMAERYATDETLADNRFRAEALAFDIFTDEMGHSEEDYDDNEFIDDYNESYTQAVERLFGNGHVKSVFLNLENPRIMSRNSESFDPTYRYGYNHHNEGAMAKRFNDGIIDEMFEERHEGLTGTQYVAFNPSQIKSADPVTYDNDGNVIPLSERFNSENEDIRFRMSNENLRVFRDIDGNYNDGIVPHQDVRYRFIGEKGAEALDKAEDKTERIDNLSVAITMDAKLNPNWDDSNDSSAKKIKIATGWEKGADGKWRYEEADFNLKNGWKKANTLAEAINDESLFAAYPELASYKVFLTLGKGDSYFNPSSNTISVKAEDESGIAISLAHEIQHAIQHIENFAFGGNVESAKEVASKMWYDKYEEIYKKSQRRKIDFALKDVEEILYFCSSIKNLQERNNSQNKSRLADLKEAVVVRCKSLQEEMPWEEGKRNVTERDLGKASVQKTQKWLEEYESYLLNLDETTKFTDAEEKAFAIKWLVDEPIEAYHRVAGEVESRNVEKRFGMTSDQRRNTLASETEDTAREEMIFSEGVQFKVANNNQRIFVSNAAKAVEGIQMGKATPEQWLKMIEKNGGLKAGEDKWMGLSDWLKSSDKKTLTKEEVLAFINENMIQIEEQHYDINAEDDAERVHGEISERLQDKFDNYVDEYYQDHDWEDGETDNAREYAIERLREEMGDTFPYTIELEYGSVYLTFPYEEEDDLVKWAEKTGVKYTSGVSPINDTRLNYTTDGLENKHEIALTVPTIERWGQHDDIHFGDAGDGRAVAWIRFGETEVPTAEYKLLLDEMDRLKEVARELYEEFGGGSNELAEVEKRQEELRLEMRSYKNAGSKVLVIDEIQSKRHQEGREKGYKTKDYWPLRTAYLEKKTVYESLYDEMANKYGEEFTDAPNEEFAKRVLDTVDYERIMKAKAEFDAASDAYIPMRNAVSDAPFDKNWHELAMKRMLRYAAENGYDVIAWTNGEQQAERYNLGKIYNEIEREDNPNIEGRTFSFSGGNYDKVTVNEDGVVVDSTIEEAKGKPLSDLVGKDLAVKMMSLENYDTIDGEELRIGGEGMKGFYDKILPAFMNKYGKKWGVKVEDIHLNLEGGLDMHSVPVTEEMKASVMEGQVMFRVRQENETPMEFEQNVLDDFKKEFNLPAPTTIVDVNDRDSLAAALGYTPEEFTDEMYNDILEGYEKGGVAFYERKTKRIPIFAREELRNSIMVNNIVFHENTHYLEDENPEILELGEWLWQNSEPELRRKIKEVILESGMYEGEEAYEMLAAYTGNIMSMGKADVAFEKTPSELQKHWELIFNAFGYEPRGKEIRRRGTGDNSGRVGSLRDRRDAESQVPAQQPRQALTAEERRVIGEYFPEFNKAEDVRMRVNSQGKELTESSDIRFRTSNNNQIKSATDNTGEFSSENEDIRFSIRTKPAPENTITVYKMVRLGEDGQPYPLFIGSAEPMPVKTWLDADSPNLGDLKKLPSGVHLINTKTGESMTLAEFEEAHPEMKNNSKKATNPTTEAINWATMNGMRFIKIVDKKTKQTRYSGEKRAYYNLGIDGGGSVAMYGMRPGWHAGSHPVMRQIGNGPEKNLRADNHVWVRGRISADVDYQAEANANPGNDIPTHIPTDGYYLKATNANAKASQADRMGWYISGSFIIDEFISDAEARRVIDVWNADHPDKKLEYDFPRESGVEFDPETDSRINDVSFRVTDTPTDEVVANGLQLTSAQTAEVAANIFAALPEESRKKITEGLNGNVLGLKDAILQIPTSLASKENWNEEDKQMAAVVREVVQDLVDANPTTRPLTTKEALWMLYDSTKEVKDLVDAASRAFVAYNLGFDPASMQRKQEVNDYLRFRTASNGAIDAATDMYNYETSLWIERLKESWLDMNQSVKSLQEALAKSSGMAIEPWENIVFALNQLSSKSYADKKKYMRDFLVPLWDAVMEIVKVDGKSIEEIERYMMLKHGLERNKKFAARDAKEFYRAMYDLVAERMKSQSHAQQVVALSEAKKALADIDAKIAVASSSQLPRLNEARARALYDVQVADLVLRGDEKLNEQELQDYYDNIDNELDHKYWEFREKDYGGLTSMFVDTTPVQRSNYKSEEAYQKAVLAATKPRFDKVADMEAEAQAEVDYFEKVVGAQNLWDKVNAATKETLRHQYEAGMITIEQYEAVRDMFKYYVPLRGFADNTAVDMYSYYMDNSASGFAQPILGAKGRKTRSESPLGWIGTMAESAIQADNKNEAKMTLYYATLRRPNQNLLSITETWYEYTGQRDANNKKIFAPAYPPATDRALNADELRQHMEDWEDDMRKKQSRGEAYKGSQKVDLKGSVVFQDSKEEKEHIIRVKVAGKDYSILINGNPRAAQAINGLLNPDAEVSPIGEWVGKLRRGMSSLLTSFSPLFWVANYQRDLLSSFMRTSESEGWGEAFKYLANRRKAWRVASYVYKYENGTLGNSYYENLYKEFAENGGITGYTVLTTNKEYEQMFADYAKNVDRKVLNAVKGAFDKFMQFGEAIEQVSRFAAYITARESGKSIEEAVNAAKEVSVNFNRKGSAKPISLDELDKLRTKDGKKLNAVQKSAAIVLSAMPKGMKELYFFFNASVQALSSSAKLAKKSPGKAATWAGLYFGTSIAMAMLNYLLSGDDDDEYLDLPDYLRHSTLLIKVSDDYYFKWSLPQEMRPFYAWADLLVSKAMGKMPHKNLGKEMALVAAQWLPVNPFEAEDPLLGLIPDFGSPIAEAWMNKTSFGGRIYDDKKFKSEAQREDIPAYRKATEKTGKVYVDLAELLNDISGGDEVVKGGININPAVVEHLVEGYGGGIYDFAKMMIALPSMLISDDPVEIKKIPFVNKVIMSVDETNMYSHVNDAFWHYSGIADNAKRVENEYRQSDDPSRADAYREEEDWRIYMLYKQYEADFKDVKERLGKAVDKEEEDLLKQEQNVLREMFLNDIAKGEIPEVTFQIREDIKRIDKEIKAAMKPANDANKERLERKKAGDVDGMLEAIEKRDSIKDTPEYKRAEELNEDLKRIKQQLKGLGSVTRGSQRDSVIGELQKNYDALVEKMGR